MRWIVRLAALSLALGGLLIGPWPTATPVAADCGSQPSPPETIGVGFKGSVTTVEQVRDGLFAVTVVVERTLAGPPRRTVTFETGDYADCHMIDGSAIHEGDELIVVGTAWWRPRTLAYPFAWRERDDARWGLSVIAPENRRRLPADLRSIDTYSEILAFIGSGLPPTDAEAAAPSGSPAPSAVPTGSPDPSASPGVVVEDVANTERPLTLDELLAVVDGSGAPETVVADVAVRLDIPSGMPVCPPRVARTKGCLLGYLDVRPASGPIIPVSATTRVSALFAEGEAPIGPLAFEVDGGHLRLLGPVAQPSGAYAVPVTAETMTAADALPLGDVIVVDGWLGVLGWGVPCPAPRGALFRQGEASPFVRCPGGWITATGDLPATSPGSIPLEPDGVGIPVQTAAYEAFASDPGPATGGATPPRHAVYLLRHVANPEPSVGPETGWLVIGRLDPVGGAAVPSPSAAPPPVIGADPPLRDPVVAAGGKVPVDHRGRPTAQGEQDGVVFELWLPRGTVRPGAWLGAHLRVTNSRSSAITVNCPPAHTRAHTHRLFDPGRRWWGRAAAFKRAILAHSWLGSVAFGSERNGIDCPGSVGLEFTIRPGGSLEYDTFALPRALVHDQPLPAGLLPVRAELRYDVVPRGRRQRSFAIEESVRLAGPDWPWATPAQVADAALTDPVFADWIATRNRPSWWGDPEAGVIRGDGRGRDRLGVNEWPDFGFTGPAPDGTVILSLAAGPPGADGWTLGRVLLDPWTAQVLGVDIGAE